MFEGLIRWIKRHPWWSLFFFIILIIATLGFIIFVVVIGLLLIRFLPKKGVTKEVIITEEPPIPAPFEFEDVGITHARLKKKKLEEEKIKKKKLDEEILEAERREEEKQKRLKKTDINLEEREKKLLKNQDKMLKEKTKSIQQNITDRLAGKMTGKTKADIKNLEKKLKNKKVFFIEGNKDENYDLIQIFLNKLKKNPNYTFLKSLPKEKYFNLVKYLMGFLLCFANGKRKQHIVDLYMVMVYHLKFILKVI